MLLLFFNFDMTIFKKQHNIVVFEILAMLITKLFYF